MLTAIRTSSSALLADPVADRERRADGALGVVLVRDRRAEDGHHRVADELLDRAAEALELGAQARVVGPQERPDVLWVELLGARREADEVGEEHRDDLALLARLLGRDGERRAAVRAESGVSSVLAAALATGLHQCNRSTT